MPLYTFTCEECGHTADKLRKLEDRDAPLTCGECGGECIRVVAKTANPRFVGSDWTEKFHA